MCMGLSKNRRPHPVPQSELLQFRISVGDIPKTPQAPIPPATWSRWT